MDNPSMRTAIMEAEKALALREIPVGAAIFLGSKLIAAAHNETEHAHDATAHAEILAIRAAGRALGNWRLSGCSIYVTLEPCPMCAAAIRAARLDSLYFGAFNRQYGAAGTRQDLTGDTTVYAGIMEHECESILARFFTQARGL